MAKTRATILSDLDDLFDSATIGSITPALLKARVVDIVEAAFLAEDDYTYPAEVETINVTSSTLGVTVDGIKVLGGQQSSVASVNQETPNDIEMATAINGILASMRAHGLIAEEI